MTGDAARGQTARDYGHTPDKSTAKVAVKRGPGRPKGAVSRPAVGTKGRQKSAGERLRAELARDGDTVGIAVLIRQAARVADRLDAIDRLLTGSADAWLVVSLPRSDEKRGQLVVEVRVDSLVVEERNQTTLLRHLLSEVHRQRAGIHMAVSSGDEDDDLDV